MIGAASATIVAPEGSTPTAAFTGHLPSWLSDLVLLAFILGAVSANAINACSSAMSVTSLGLRLPRWLGRSALVVLSGLAGTATAWASLADAGHAYEAFLLVIAYWVGPWLGVVLVERWTRSRTPAEELAPRLGDRTFTNWPGITALLAGIAVSVPLFSNQEKYVGRVPEQWPSFGDITCLVGFVVSAGVYAGVYAALRRGRSWTSGQEGGAGQESGVGQEGGSGEAVVAAVASRARAVASWLSSSALSTCTTTPVSPGAAGTCSVS